MVDPLALDAAAVARKDPRCAQKVAKNPFSYFRYTNRPFVDVVCRRYADAIPNMPMVHAHGDAHLEQYAVAVGSRGLADFDASAVGPPIVDLARFSTSVVLASRGDDTTARTAIDAFLRGYQRALEDPSATLPEPTVARRLRSRFDPSAVAWLDRVEKLIVPIPAAEQPRYEAGWANFVGQMRAQDSSIDPAFFTIKVGGRLDAGIGSAHSEKFLVRLEGPTPAPEDDLVMEAKALEPGALGSCMHGLDLDATRVIEGQAQLSNAPQRFLAAMQIAGKPFYSHTWLVHYTELSVGDIVSGAELAELSEDVGQQLGRGHTKLRDPAKKAALRADLRRLIATLGPELPGVSFELAGRVTRAWERYRTELAQ
ncbi:MAG: hypothetical protein K0S65_2111 [Labilithrix sp.]|nr:hypothetical protein [Labilithrix sp.]